MLNWVMLFASLLVAEDSSARSGRVQPQSPRAGAAAEESPGLDLGIEFRRDRFRYRFENPSSFNTSFPVPHFFEQSYRVDTRWLDLRGRYRVLGRLWETEVGLTPDTTGSGDDYDTFFNPDGNLIVYGTRADVSIRSWRFRHSIALTRVAGFDTWIGYSFRRDRAAFPASYSTTTQSNPPSFTSFWNAGRESTISDVHEVRISAGRAARLATAWRVNGRVDLTPLGVARLTTLLPDRYPGQPIVFVARGPSLEASVSVNRRIGRFRIEASADIVHSWSYGSANQFHRDSAGVRVTAGF